MMKSLFLFLLGVCSQVVGFQKSEKVVVIGAGISGLTCAHRLKKEGYDVEVYEARKRIGGRIFTVQIGDYLVELGAQNIRDGGEATHIRELISELKLDTESRKAKMQSTYVENDISYDLKKLIKNKGFTAKRLKSELRSLYDSSKNMQEILDALLQEDPLLNRAISLTLSAYEGAPPECLSTIYISTLYHQLLGGLAGAHPEDQEFMVHEWVLGGNTKLLEKLVEDIPLFLNSPLEKIEKDQSQILLTFSDGKKVGADIVVLTIPCPVFSNIEIDPSLISSARKKDITSIRYGTNSKIVLPISDNLEDKGAIKNERAVFFRNTRKDMLNFYYTGEYGRFNKESINSHFQRDLPLVQKFFNPQLNAPVVVAADQSYARYEGPVGHSFPEDPYAKGSYSYASPGQETLFFEEEEIRGERVKKLFSPIDDKLFFAGEHTSILYEVSGTMEAACESGERCARLIESRHKNTPTH